MRIPKSGRGTCVLTVVIRRRTTKNLRPCNPPTKQKTMTQTPKPSPSMCVTIQLHPCTITSSTCAHHISHHAPHHHHHAQYRYQSSPYPLLRLRLPPSKSSAPYLPPLPQSHSLLPLRGSRSRPRSPPAVRGISMRSMALRRPAISSTSLPLPLPPLPMESVCFKMPLTSPPG